MPGDFFGNLTFFYWHIVVDYGSWISQVHQKVQWNRSKNIYDNQSKVFVCVCYLLLFRQVGRLIQEKCYEPHYMFSTHI